MYVCICKGITENQIRNAIRCGACTRKDIARCLKAGTACGKCNQQVQELLRSGRSMSSAHEGGVNTFAGSSRNPMPRPEPSAASDRARPARVLEGAMCPA